MTAREDDPGVIANLAYLLEGPDTIHARHREVEENDAYLVAVLREDRVHGPVLTDDGDVAVVEASSESLRHPATDARLAGAHRTDEHEGAARHTSSSAPSLTEVVRSVAGIAATKACRFRRVSATDIPELRRALVERLRPVALFGGGHVGAAIARLLAGLPFSVRWIDSRDGVFPEELPAQVETEHSEPVQDAVASLAPGSRVLIMSFSHAEDLDIVIACLRRLRAREGCALRFRRW